MVAVIHSGNSLRRIITYNENKVSQGHARCIGAVNYPLDKEMLPTAMKLGVLEKRTALNRNTRRNSVHISLNFDTSENAISDGKMMAVTESYMERLGFGQQPFLVYRHQDAGHPHLHIVTTNIQGDGSRIDLHHLGIRKSEPARKTIEQEFGLVVAESKKQVSKVPSVVNTGKVTYGKAASKKAIQNVLHAVLNKYLFTSIPEFNAVLGVYNVRAETGAEGSRLLRYKGLQYSIIGEDKKTVGVPIKASLFFESPTLSNLEKKFASNLIKRNGRANGLRNFLDHLIDTRPITLEQLIAAANKAGIDIICRRNLEGFLYGVTYVDHRNASVFNGSTLGKDYSAKALQQRCLPAGTQLQTGASLREIDAVLKDAGNIIAAFLQPENNFEFTATGYKKKRKKRKRKDNNT